MILPIFKLEEHFLGISKNKVLGILELISLLPGKRPVRFDFRTFKYKDYFKRMLSEVMLSPSGPQCSCC